MANSPMAVAIDKVYPTLYEENEKIIHVILSEDASRGWCIGVESYLTWRFILFRYTGM